MHRVKCFYCGTTFDRDKEQYCLINSRRYAHASCMLREAEKDPKYIKKEIIDPSNSVICTYCKKELLKTDEDCILVREGIYAHKECQEIENKREKTDEEKLDDYIKKLFNTSYVEPRVRMMIKKYRDQYNYTYSGMLKALYYFYEIKKGDISKANNSIGIIPYIYQDAYNYFYELWLIQQKNENIQIQLYEPKIKEIVIPRPQRSIKKRNLFKFLDEENVNK